MEDEAQITVDARGLSCPIPQQRTMAAIRSAKQGAAILVLVDEVAARDSVVRTAKALQISYELERKGDEYEIRIFRRSYEL